MAILNPEHLFDQAERLIQPPPAGPPRQVDLRRAVSAAYYAVFHAVLIAVADEFVGKTKRNTPEYRLAYRTLDHKRLKDICTTVMNPISPKSTSKVALYAPPHGFGAELQGVAAAIVDLQEKRHTADYDPSGRVKTADALLAIRTGRSAVARLGRAGETERKRFLALLTFPPR